jgi:L-alanine-DL-glutamate epimerase-like enolase superfamily enzyme
LRRAGERIRRRQPDEAIKSTRIVTGEISTGAEALTDRTGALAAAYDIPVIPHGGGHGEGIHYIMATTNAPWAGMFMPAPGGPNEVYDLWEERYNLPKGPQGVYMRPLEKPGFGWDISVS